MNVAHDMQPLRPGDPGYNWRSRARRCRHCHINEAHADSDRCPVLIHRQNHQLAQVTVDMMNTTMDAAS